jgi:sugar O-acyltransferase (sialic acid O-acetyltransferase NeuD family)
MNRRLVIVGASGHGKVVADIARLTGYGEIVFLDNDPSLRECAGWPVLGSDVLLDTLDGDVFIAVGSGLIRKRLMDGHPNRSFPVLIHPSAVVAHTVQMGCGTVVMAGAVINPDAVLGRGVIVNTSSSIDHDCSVGNYCHIAVGAHLSGTVTIGEGTWVGAGAIVSNNIGICANCMIGAGAVVVRDIGCSGTYVGVPAQKVK